MTSEPSELRRLLDDFNSVRYTGPNFKEWSAFADALVTRLDALTEAKGAGRHVFRKGDRVRIVRNEGNNGDISQSYVGCVGVIQSDPSLSGDSGFARVLLDNGQGVSIYCYGDGAEVEPVADKPLASGNLAAVTAAKIVQGGVWYVREEMYQSVEAERDEARAKLGVAERTRAVALDANHALSARLTAAESALAGERERIEEAWAQGDAVFSALNRYFDVADTKNDEFGNNEDKKAHAAIEAYCSYRNYRRRAARTNDELEPCQKCQGTGLMAVFSDPKTRDPGRIGSYTKEFPCDECELRKIESAFAKAASPLTHDSRRRATTGGEQYVPPTRYEKVVNMGPTPTSASGDPPSPAAPDFERRVEALSDDFASGGVNWNSLARRALKAEDEAKRLRDMIAEYVAAKSAGTSGPTSPSAVRLYRAERALKDAAQPEAGR